jgi:hypothetical protein
VSETSTILTRSRKAKRVSSSAGSVERFSIQEQILAEEYDAKKTVAAAADPFDFLRMRTASFASHP